MPLKQLTTCHPVAYALFRSRAPAVAIATATSVQGDQAHLGLYTWASSCKGSLNQILAFLVVSEVLN